MWEIRRRIDPQTFKLELRNYLAARRDKIGYETEIFRAYPRVSGAQRQRAAPDSGDKKNEEQLAMDDSKHSIPLWPGLHTVSRKPA